MHADRAAVTVLAGYPPRIKVLGLVRLSEVVCRENINGRTAGYGAVRPVVLSSPGYSIRLQERHINGSNPFS